MVDLLSGQLVVGRLAIGGALRGRDVAADGDDGQRVIVLDLVRRIVPVGDHTDATGHEEEQDRKERRGAALASRT